MNFYKVENQNINLDKVINFTHADCHLYIWVDTSQPFCFFDKDKELYTAFCNHVYGERRTDGR